MLKRDEHQRALAQGSACHVQLWKKNDISAMRIQMLQPVWRFNLFLPILRQHVSANQLPAMNGFHVVLGGCSGLIEATHFCTQRMQPRSKVFCPMQELNVVTRQGLQNLVPKRFRILQDFGSIQGNSHLRKGSILPVMRVANPALSHGHRVDMPQSNLHCHELDQGVVLGFGAGVVTDASPVRRHRQSTFTKALTHNLICMAQGSEECLYINIYYVLTRKAEEMHSHKLLRHIKQKRNVRI